MMKKARALAVALLVLIAFSQNIRAVSPATLVSDLLAKTGLNYSPYEGQDNFWTLTYVGLENMESLDLYVWAREFGYVTIYTTIFSLEEEPSKSLLWRLFELNDAMLGLKYVIREHSEEKGVYLVDCQVDLSLTAINANELKEAIEELVVNVDENYPELEALL
ncbi:MAG: YbjN domain-containing protein [Firmicutes bacterium]|nr:YbjN domain-containing protein [Bacillota bacterium]